MKTSSITRMFLLAIVAISITFTACQKEKITSKAPANKIMSAANMKNTADALYLSNAATSELQDALFMSAKAKQTNTLKINTTGATITYDTISKPYTETIDYGTGTTGSDGNLRSGQIIITYTNADISVPSTSKIISFNNYFLNHVQMTGSESIYNNGDNVKGNLTFSVNYNVQSLPADGIDSVVAGYLYEWVQGQNSKPYADLQFSITGNSYISVTSTGQTINAPTIIPQTITTSITAPLLRNYVTPGCNYYVQGTELIHSSISPDQTVDYGNGTCTGMETITSNGQTTTKHQ